MESSPPHIMVRVTDLPAEVLAIITGHIPDAKGFVGFACTCVAFGAVTLIPSVSENAKRRFVRRVERQDDYGLRCIVWVFPNGTKHGPEEGWNVAGVCIYRCPWVDGKRHGPEERWDAAGVCIYRCHWVDGKRHGTEEWWNAAGERTYRRHWANGKPHGPEERWNAAGVCIYRCPWANGKQHGPEEEWNDEGEHTYQRHWVDGEQHETEDSDATEHASK